MQLRPTGWSVWRCPGLQTQVREDPFDHLKDRGDDLQSAAAIAAMLRVDLASKASAKTNVYPSYAAAKTRLTSRGMHSRGDIKNWRRASTPAPPDVRARGQRKGHRVLMTR